MTCIAKWVPSTPGADGIVLADVGQAARYVMEKLELAERQTASILVDPSTTWKITEIARHYRRCFGYPGAGTLGPDGAQPESVDFIPRHAAPVPRRADLGRW